MSDNNKENSILIVEDSEVNTKILKEILGGQYELFFARDGLEGVEMAISKQPDLMLLDIVLPKMDGYEVIETIRKTPETKELPIIFVTSLSDIDNERKGLELGADDYINKPYDVTVLELRIGIQMRIINQMRTIQLLSAEIEQWMKS